MEGLAFSPLLRSDTRRSSAGALVHWTTLPPPSRRRSACPWTWSHDDPPGVTFLLREGVVAKPRVPRTVALFRKEIASHPNRA
jgi:hypothetical protein